nr:hypothetical protein [Gordonia sp. (in: high G+C Gram-positive bacteria)]
TDVAGASVAVRDRAGSGPADSLFHDPFIDGPAPAALTVLVLGVPRREWQLRHRTGALGEAVLVVGSVNGESEQAAAPGSPMDTRGDLPADLEPLLSALLRVDMAAVYLRLIRGS